jgi:xanthine dehydrogenase accessory factor
MNIWKFIQGKLAQNDDVMLMVVLDSSGSSPGKQGFKMAVTKNKALFGSIGGGSMEFEMVELAYSLLNSEKVSPFLKKQIHSEGDKDEHTGALCSGSQIIGFFPLNHSYLTEIEKICQAFDSSGQGVIRISNLSFEYLKEKLIETPYQTMITNENEWEYIEKHGKLNKICIIGAGHVGLALSKIMKDLDFIVEIYDDRLGLNTFENNEYVNKKLKIDYKEIDKLLVEGDNVYVVIMTFGHQSDQLVLQKLLHKEFKYLGIMGSKAKVKSIFQNIGLSQEQAVKKNVHAPIGIPIKSQTPVEIAISIAAEIIKIKNRQN